MKWVLLCVYICVCTVLSILPADVPYSESLRVYYFVSMANMFTVPLVAAVSPILVAVASPILVAEAGLLLVAVNQLPALLETLAAQQVQPAILRIYVYGKFN